MLALLVLLTPAATAAQTPDLTNAGHVRGRADAGVDIVEFADFACAFCGQFARETWPAIARDWIDSGRARFRFVPFNMSVFAPGRLAARTAGCAAEQGRFWAMHDLLFEKQREWLGRGSQQERMRAYAAEAGLDPAAFDACWEEDRWSQRIAEQTAMARALEVRATPTFFINGVRVEGALSERDFRAVLEAAEREQAAHSR